LEQLSAWNPGWVFVVSYRTPAAQAAGRIMAEGLLKGAVRGFPADYSSWDQADSRWILGLEWLAATMHPDRFAGFDMSAEVIRFYHELYGIDAGVIRDAVLPRLKGLRAGR
jgi:iron complex transport system substrate-binding protein